MKDFRKSPSPQFNPQSQDLSLLKALVQFSLQVESKEIDLKDLFKPARKAKPTTENYTDTFPHLWRGCQQQQQQRPVRQRSSSIELKGERVPLTKYWRRSLTRRTQKSTTKENGFLSQENLVEQSLSLQQQLAITALNLTAPACSSILRNYRNNWVQLSGHPGSLAPAGPGAIWKKQPKDTNETWVYERLMKDVAKSVVPKFYRELTHEGERYIEITDLLYGFVNPSIMDIKIGNRTFLESEVSNTEARNDLYKKMVKLDPNAPTAEEHETKAVTKLRYMDVREQMSSSRTLSFRVEALKMSNSSPVTELKTVHTREEVVEVLSSFIQRKDFVKKEIINRLRTIRDTFEKSEFFRNHEVVGSSVLVIYDHHRVGAWIIDFAKTCPLSEDITITHRKEWSLGNHEEGYLTGLDNLIECFQDVSVSKNSLLKHFFNTT
ncbi:UNVERIFIED_CONTAM: hypothetical protein RMT77_007208 [Armadillidium vulgare]